MVVAFARVRPYGELMTITRTTETVQTHPALTTSGTADATVIALDFGIADDKGRALGGRVEIFPHIAFGSTPAGFAAYWTATREGATFGAGNRAIFASSADACEQIAIAKLRATRERYAKKFAK